VTSIRQQLDDLEHRINRLSSNGPPHRYVTEPGTEPSVRSLPPTADEQQAELCREVIAMERTVPRE
jgi:hypothetical protein